MRIVCILFFLKLGKISQNMSSAAVVIGALKVKFDIGEDQCFIYSRGDGDRWLSTFKFDIILQIA